MAQARAGRAAEDSLLELGAFEDALVFLRRACQKTSIKRERSAGEAMLTRLRGAFGVGWRGNRRAPSSGPGGATAPDRW